MHNLASLPCTRFGSTVRFETYVFDECVAKGIQVGGFFVFPS